MPRSKGRAREVTIDARAAAPALRVPTSIRCARPITVVTGALVERC
jgi:hypothetical protein